MKHSPTKLQWVAVAAWVLFVLANPPSAEAAADPISTAGAVVTSALVAVAIVVAWNGWRAPDSDESGSPA